MIRMSALLVYDGRGNPSKVANDYSLRSAGQRHHHYWWPASNGRKAVLQATRKPKREYACLVCTGKAIHRVLTCTNRACVP